MLNKMCNNLPLTNGITIIRKSRYMKNVNSIYFTATIEFSKLLQRTATGFFFSSHEKMLLLEGTKWCTIASLGNGDKNEKEIDGKKKLSVVVGYFKEPFL